MAETGSLLKLELGDGNRASTSACRPERGHLIELALCPTSRHAPHRLVLCGGRPTFAAPPLPLLMSPRLLLFPSPAPPDPAGPGFASVSASACLRATFAKEEVSGAAVVETSCAWALDMVELEARGVTVEAGEGAPTMAAAPSAAAAPTRVAATEGPRVSRGRGGTPERRDNSAVDCVVLKKQTHDI